MRMTYFYRISVMAYLSDLLPPGIGSWFVWN
jgi:hypothetical protein